MHGGDDDGIDTDVSTPTTVVATRYGDEESFARLSHSKVIAAMILRSYTVYTYPNPREYPTSRSHHKGAPTKYPWSVQRLQKIQTVTTLGCMPRSNRVPFSCTL